MEKKTQLEINLSEKEGYLNKNKEIEAKKFSDFELNSIINKYDEKDYNKLLKEQKLKEEFLLYFKITSNRKFSTNQNFLKEICSNYEKNFFLNFIRENLNDKKITFIRHGEAEHNYFYKNKKLYKYRPTLDDPKLTEDGKKLVTETKNKLIEENKKFDIVFVSPLSRTIQTLLVLQENSNIFRDNTEFHFMDLIREIMSDKEIQKGLSRKELMEKYSSEKFRDFYLQKNFWWSDIEDENYSDDFDLEEKNEFTCRLILFLVFLAFIDYENILIISHSEVGHLYVREQKIKQDRAYHLENDHIFQKIENWINQKI